ncbi:MAG: hypothetical protein CVV56_07435 [Tenericutes bacterium HGW-Tenericutes-1]|jgi:hypothetical protein|nr:MAG: hypothetical protein CVV56_07435 [Tenericutes bacterium HGW-Tenericutes-1]
MHIQCTKKLLDFLKPPMTIKNTDDDIYAWHADYMNIGRKKFYVIMNDLTRYCIVLYGLKKSDFKDILIIIKNAIYITMIEQNFEEELIINYLYGIEEVTYDRTKNRFLISQLNRAMFEASWCIEDGIYIDTFEQPQIAVSINESFVGTNHWKVTHRPFEKMHEYLKLLL